MEKEKLYRLMSNTESMDDTTLVELKEMVERYPYFSSSRLLYTKSLELNNHTEYGNELSRSALLCADRRRLYYLIHKESYRPFLEPREETAPPTGNRDRTEALLDSFLTSLPERDPQEPAIPESAMNIISTDYLYYLESLSDEGKEKQTEEQKLHHHDIIDTFIEKAASEPLFTPGETPSPKSKPSSDNGDDESEFLTETLARIYIKQKKYGEALTIIKRLSLNFPKKSVYFADQIRFLEYLIINEKNKNK